MTAANGRLPGSVLVHTFFLSRFCERSLTLRIINISRLENDCRLRLVAATGAIEWLAMDDEKESSLIAKTRTGWLRRIYQKVIGMLRPEGLL